jgi:hypothetical protein
VGVDLCGWIECRPLYPQDSLQWDAVTNLYYLAEGRDYDAFACFFGVKNYARFRPIADRRGVPSDASKEVREELAPQDPAYVMAPSWVTWAELKAIDWDEPAELPDQRVHIYRLTEEGAKTFDTKAVVARSFLEEASQTEEQRQAARDWREGAEWHIEGRLYRVERLKRSDTRGYWEGTLQFMEFLAHRFGDDGVRMVVWFNF